MYLNSGTVIKAGEKIVIGTKSTQNAKIDILWDDKNVINDSKTDTITLNNPYGQIVCALTANE